MELKQIIDFSETFSPLYGRTIIIPEKSVFYRAYSTKYPVLSNRPAYFGNKEIAKGYTTREEPTVLGAFTNTRELHLLDYRFMKVILKQFFDEVSKDSKFGKEEKNVISSVTVSFGLCSLEHQIRLIDTMSKDYTDACTGFKALKALYKGPSLIEKPGIRVGETENDAITMGFLQSLLSNTFDGFVSPRIDSVFHGEKGGYITPEMIIFNPINSRIKILPFEPTNLPLLSIHDIVMNNYLHVSIVKSNIKTNFSVGGAKNTHHTLETFDDELNKQNKNIINNYNMGMRVGSKWFNKQIYITKIVAPHPQVKVDIWDSTGQNTLEIA